MAEEPRYYRRKCSECGYYCVFQIVEKDDKFFELCTHCQATEPIGKSMIGFHIQQCESWLENQGRMWKAVRPKLEQLAHPGDHVDLFGTVTKAKEKKE